MTDLLSPVRAAFTRFYCKAGKEYYLAYHYLVGLIMSRKNIKNMETNNQQNAEPDGAYPKAPEGPLHSFHLKPETRNFKKVVKHTF
jgi:hypothetical protein